ncbi:MAG: hypothetical protein MO853_00465 [Candidatus Protistobacter heckmanni]|nr:hypothetical protein [Candidatus Protistobacter heckmanni]
MIEARLPPGLPEAERDSLTLAILAQLIGGLMLSRAVDDRTLSDAILKACRQQAMRAPSAAGADDKNK